MKMLPKQTKIIVVACSVCKKELNLTKDLFDQSTSYECGDNLDMKITCPNCLNNIYSWKIVKKYSFNEKTS